MTPRRAPARCVFVIAAMTLVLAAFSHPVLAIVYVVPADDVLIHRADAIVVARAIHSDVRDSRERGIETVTVFALEEVLKGESVETGFAVDVPGGTLVKRGRTLSKFVPGVARFVDGDRVLLFLNRTGDTEYAVTDIGLGFFGFAYDETGRRVLVRPLDAGSKYRDADAFAGYIRGRVAGKPVVADYSLEAKPLVGRSPSLKATMMTLDPKAFTCSGCTVTQYTMGSAEASAGYRWKTFPVNWNRGNSEPNATSNGDDAIANAFGQWANASGAAYVPSSTASNTSGILEPPDGVNNVVFEKDMTSIGVGAFNCSAGGLLGIGGINTSTTDSSNTVNGETFYATSEADVSMNQGIGACLGSGQLTQGDFKSAVMHEVGHTLGLRHSDQSRDDSQPCTNFPSYDCATSAIMTALLTTNLNGAIQSWDQRAITALYPANALAAPTGVIAKVNSTGSVSVSWNPVSGAVNGSTTYHVFRTSDNINYAEYCTATAPDVTCTDFFTSANTAYLYKVRADSSGPFSSPDLATVVTFTDDPLVAHSTIVRRVHITELRAAVDLVRKLANGGIANPYPSYTDPNIVQGVTPVRAAHVNELRNVLNSARLTLGVGSFAFGPDVVAGSTVIAAAHITDLRTAVRRRPQ